jgi:hypothetical protein
MGCRDDIGRGDAGIGQSQPRKLHALTWYSGSCDSAPSNTPNSLQHDYGLDAINVSG